MEQGAGKAAAGLPRLVVLQSIVSNNQIWVTVIARIYLFIRSHFGRECVSQLAKATIFFHLVCEQEREASQMLQEEPIPGPIEGLRLPRRAWTVLKRENIRTLDQLKVVAVEIERVMPGIGCKTAQTIRTELARVTPG
jgi:DNA-directed RNA polymerase alpha subunit